MLVRRSLLAALAASTLVLAAGCAAPATEADSAEASGSATCVIEDASALGDAIELKLVTDQAGSYCHLTADLEAIQLLPESKYAENVSKAGYSSETTVAGQQLAAQWWVEEVLDGPVLDADGDAVAEWLASTPLIAERWRHQYVDSWADGEDSTSSIVALAALDTPVPVFRRDNQSRLHSVSVEITNVDAVEFEGEPFIQIISKLGATYVGSDKGEYALTVSAAPVAFPVAEDGSVSLSVQGSNVTGELALPDGPVVEVG